MPSPSPRQRLLETSYGERTTPGVERENYWFRRHEVAYRWVVDMFASDLRSGTVLDAGSGEGYGADLLSEVAPDVLAAELNPVAVAHSSAMYPRITTVRTNLDAFPLVDGSLAAVVTMQVIEHLWDLPRFLDECLRVLRPGGLLVAATPNRLTFSPGLGRGEKPTNLFHVEEFDAAQMLGLATDAGFAAAQVLGVHHGPRLSRWQADHGDIVAAHVAAALSGEWPPALLRMIAGVEASDFQIDDTADDAALDLILVAHKPVADSA